MAKRTQSTALTVRTDKLRDDDDEAQTGAENEADGEAETEAQADPEAEKVEKIPEPEDLVIPAALLLAAESASDHKRAFPKYEGVHLHVVEGVCRVVSSDGGKMFVGSFKINGEAPAWMTPGITISNDGLKARIAMIAKNDSSAGQVRLRYADGLANAELSDARRTMAFQVAIVNEEFPDYQRSIPAEAFITLDAEGEAQGREWDPVGINSIYLKHVGEIAKTLEAGLPKDLRSKNGMVVRAYNAGPSRAPLVFDFSTWPGAILIVGAARMDTQSTSKETAALLAPAIKLTLAALRAHETRNLAWAEQAEDEFAKANFLTKAQGFRDRVAAILARAPGLPALAAPEPEPPNDDVLFGPGVNRNDDAEFDYGDRDEAAE